MVPVFTTRRASHPACQPPVGSVYAARAALKHVAYAAIAGSCRTNRATRAVTRVRRRFVFDRDHATAAATSATVFFSMWRRTKAARSSPAKQLRT